MHALLGALTLLLHATSVVALLTGAALRKDRWVLSICAKIEDYPVVGATVRCYDADTGEDTPIGPHRGVATDARGCARLVDDGWWWEEPDPYCKVLARPGDCYDNTTTMILNGAPGGELAEVAGARFPGNDNFGTIYLHLNLSKCGDLGKASDGCGPATFPSWMRYGPQVATGTIAAACSERSRCYRTCRTPRSACDDGFTQGAAMVGMHHAMTAIYNNAHITHGLDDCLGARAHCDPDGKALCSQ